MKKLLKVAGLTLLCCVSPVCGAAAIAGTTIHDHNVKQNKKSYDNGYNTAKAEDIAYENDLRNKMKSCAERIKKCQNYDEFEKMIIPLFAVGISAANADGEISSEEKEVMKDVISGLSQQAIPEHIVKQISQFFLEPPSFNTAMEYVLKFLNNDLQTEDNLNAFDEVIDFVIGADDVINEKEHAFKESWVRFKAQCLNDHRFDLA